MAVAETYILNKLDHQIRDHIYKYLVQHNFRDSNVENISEHNLYHLNFEHNLWNRLAQVAIWESSAKESKYYTT